MLVLILGVLFALYLITLYVLNYRNSNKGIPHLGGYVPIIGHALSFAKDPVGFIKQAQAKYGDTFSACIMGRKLIFVTNVHDANYVIVNKDFVSEKIQKNVLSNSFGISLATLEAENGEIHKTAFKHVHTYLHQPQDLEDLTRRAQEQFERFFFADKNKNWQRGKLFEFVGDSVVSASLAALLGDDYFDFTDLKFIQDLKNTFFEFDQARTSFDVNLPSFLLSKAYASRTKFMSLFTKHVSSKASTFLQLRLQLYKNIAKDEEELGGIMGIIVWVSLVNTIAASFWLLAHVLTKPELHKEILEELEGIILVIKPAEGSKLPNITQDMFAQMKKLQAVLDETLRYYTTAMVPRDAGKDMTCTFHNGSKVQFFKDDQLIMCPERVSFDELIYNNAKEFQWDRFLNSNKTYKRNGKDLSFNQAFLVFGGGIHKCPGRFFAMNEIKILVVLMLLTFDIKMEEKIIPDMAYHRFSGGLLPPVTDMNMEYKIKDQFL